jgi:hypothetical protein
MHWQRKAKIHVQNLPFSHSLHHESHTDWPGIEPGHLRWLPVWHGTASSYQRKDKGKSKGKDKVVPALKHWTCRLLEEWKYESTHYEILHRMAVNGQPIASRFIPSQTDAVPAGQEAGWAPELEWALWSDKTPASAASRTPIPRSSTIVPVNISTYVSHLEGIS